MTTTQPEAPKEAVMLWMLSPGVIDERAVRAFKYGACGGLAVALHDATGWPIVAVNGSDGLALHYMARDPAGQLIDIEGAHTERDVTFEYEIEADDDGITLTDTTRDAVWAWYQDYAGIPVPMDIVDTIAAAVLGAL